jgi:hypothetical protein
MLWGKDGIDVKDVGVSAQNVQKTEIVDTGESFHPFKDPLHG